MNRQRRSVVGSEADAVPVHGISVFLLDKNRILSVNAEMDLMTVARIMNACIVDLYEDGEIDAGDIDTIEFYGFSPEQVERLHYHKIGVGDGIWFRLKDGRVFNKYAESSSSDPDLYDTVAN